MSERVTYHVVPNKEEGNWRVERESSERASSVHDNKEDAVDEARRLAKNNPLGQIIIHGKDGVIQEERTYGKDPEKYPG